MLLLAEVLATQETTTTAVPRVAGEPLPSWVLIAVAFAVLAFIVVGGLLVNRRSRSQG